MTRTSDGLQIIGTSRLELDGDIHKLVTFLNQTLKDKGYIFGISKDGNELVVSIYQTDEAN